MRIVLKIVSIVLLYLVQTEAYAQTPKLAKGDGFTFILVTDGKWVELFDGEPSEFPIIAEDDLGKFYEILESGIWIEKAQKTIKEWQKDLKEAEALVNGNPDDEKAIMRLKLIRSMATTGDISLNETSEKISTKGLSGPLEKKSNNSSNDGFSEPKTRLLENYNVLNALIDGNQIKGFYFYKGDVIRFDVVALTKSPRLRILNRTWVYDSKSSFSNEYVVKNEGIHFLNMTGGKKGTRVKVYRSSNKNLMDFPINPQEEHEVDFVFNSSKDGFIWNTTRKIDLVAHDIVLRKDERNEYLSNLRQKIIFKGSLNVSQRPYSAGSNRKIAVSSINNFIAFKFFKGDTVNVEVDASAYPIQEVNIKRFLCYSLSKNSGTSTIAQLVGKSGRGEVNGLRNEAITFVATSDAVFVLSFKKDFPTILSKDVPVKLKVTVNKGSLSDSNSVIKSYGMVVGSETIPFFPIPLLD